MERLETKFGDCLIGFNVTSVKQMKKNLKCRLQDVGQFIHASMCYEFAKFIENDCQNSLPSSERTIAK